MVTEPRDLYAVPLDDFVAERDALVARLRSEKRAAEAKSVKALRKPSVAVWAINQAARDRPEEAGQLAAVGARLEKEQQDVLAGEAPAELRAADAERKRLIARLADAATAALERAGSAPGSHRERIRNTLLAASVDAGARERLRAGALTEEMTPSGFESVFALGAPPPPAGADEERKETAARHAARLEKDADRAEREAARLVARADEAEAAAAAVRTRADRAVAAAKEARARADEARAAT